MIALMRMLLTSMLTAVVMMVTMMITMMLMSPSSFRRRHGEKKSIGEFRDCSLNWIGNMFAHLIGLVTERPVAIFILPPLRAEMCQRRVRFHCESLARQHAILIKLSLNSIHSWPQWEKACRKIESASHDERARVPAWWLFYIGDQKAWESEGGDNGMLSARRLDRRLDVQTHVRRNAC